ncbi:hypothetical protein [Actinocorallia longicatena]|uniref:Uncharacterized protein n=1 Tax=Actinocorallia longicatena TaxID=111803 RepID=A0ABP6Q2J1_9ACTN
MNAILILFMIAVPAACFAWMLPGLDPLGRATAGVAASLCLLTLVVQVMIIFKAWSPVGGAVAVAVVSLAAALLAWRRRPIHRAEAEAAAKAEEDEDWLFAE